MKITKERTKAIVNQADHEVTHVEITDINEGDQTIFTNLFIDGELLATGRVYTFDNFPCENLNHGEKELIKGNNPTDEWYVDEIKLWLDSKQTKVNGEISEDDPYYYPTYSLKADLLKLVNPEVNLDNELSLG